MYLSSCQTPRMIDVLRLFDEVHLLHARLGQFMEDLHGTAVTAPERAVLEYLRAHGPTPVPHIARDRMMTRQHIQGIVDALLPRHLVRADHNPAHRRSSLIVLTEAGRQALDDMQHRELRELRARLATSPVTMGKIAAATEVLARLRHDLGPDVTAARSGARLAAWRPAR